ncbi:MAG: endonuclease/exonuclease/phosphatase family protein [Candidatus Nanoarchaeia archaeon]|nr:endonuclease/exonuclease/phosphatase family protein [Candidatus Nanoarchaeia archaeon]
MKLRIVQLNFWGLPWPFSVWRKTRLQDLVEFIQNNKPDIINLSEVWFGSDVEYLELKLKDYHFSHTDFGALNESGLLTISKYPIKFKRFIPFNRSELFSRKGILISECKINKKTFKIINTHFFHSRKLHKSYVVREQLDRLKNYLDKRVPTILAGDFNLDYDKIKLPFFKIISKINVPTLNKENRYTHKLFNGLYSINLRCDLIFSNFKAKILKKEIYKLPLLSDHYLVFSEIMV